MPSSTRLSTFDTSQQLGAVGTVPKFQELQSEFEMASRSVTHVITAFRELQAKSRILEQDRFSTIKERDELKAKLIELQRDISLHRSHSEIKATENLLVARRESEKVKLAVGTVEEQLIGEEDAHRSLQRGITARETIISTLESDLRQLDGKLHSLRRAKSVRSQDFEAAEARCERLVANVDEANYKHQERCTVVNTEIDSVKRELDKADKSLLRSSMRLSAMEKYLELVLSINGDLCETLAAREEAKSRILKLAGQYAPPRYTWPKTAPYPTMANVVDVISDAATASALQDRAAQAVRVVTKALHKTKRSKSATNSRRAKERESVSLSSQSTEEPIGTSNLTARLRGLRPKSASAAVTRPIKRPPLKVIKKATPSGIVSSPTETRHLSPGRLLEKRAAEIVAAVAMSTSNSPYRYTSPSRTGESTTPVSDAFIPSSGNINKEFNSIAKDRTENRETLQRFAAFASK